MQMAPALMIVYFHGPDAYKEDNDSVTILAAERIFFIGMALVSLLPNAQLLWSSPLSLAPNSVNSQLVILAISYIGMEHSLQPVIHHLRKELKVALWSENSAIFHARHQHQFSTGMVNVLLHVAHPIQLSLKEPNQCVSPPAQIVHIYMIMELVKMIAFSLMSK